MSKMISYSIWLYFAITLPLIIEGTILHAMSYAATEDISLGGIKALYGGETAGRGASLQPQTLSDPGGIKPTLEAIPCPDGVTRSALAILALVRAANPELPIWKEPALVQALSGERGVWQWIKDHIKLSIDAFGLHFQIHGDGDFCGQLTVMWWNGWNATWEPC
ncbi:hypothetical protein FJ251_04825 [bacterium]|nr:hypothetical protein [bacterium]